MRDGRGDGQTLEADLSELRGRTYRCIDDCALCCLCQPELLPEEEDRFKKDPKLSAGTAQEHISPEVTGMAIRLQGEHGACFFLSNRRCGIYGHRPHFCRSFPLNVFVGWRVQVNVNLSCRGVGLPGEDLLSLGQKLVSGYGEERLTAEVSSAKEVFTQFVRNCRDASVAQSFSSVREATRLLSEELTDGIGLSRVMTYAEHARTRQNSGAVDIVRRVRAMEAEADLSERAMMDGIELFDLPDLSLLPVYVDQGLRWKIFRLIGKDIIGYDLEEDGTVTEFFRISPADVDLLPVNAGGREAIGDYLALANARDCFLGHAAYLCDSEGYEYNFGQVYLGAVANNVVDLWWRASLLAHMSGADELGPAQIREGIVFFDMDLLDLPTIGAFI